MNQSDEIQALAFIGCIVVMFYLGTQYPELRLRDIFTYYWKKVKEKMSGQNKTTDNQ